MYVRVCVCVYISLYTKKWLTFCWIDDSWQEEEWRQSNAQGLGNVRLHVQVSTDLKVHRRKTCFFSVAQSTAIMQRLSARVLGAASFSVIKSFRVLVKWKWKSKDVCLDSIDPVKLYSTFFSCFNYSHEEESIMSGVSFLPPSQKCFPWLLKFPKSVSLLVLTSVSFFVTSYCQGVFFYLSLTLSLSLSFCVVFPPFYVRLSK